MTASSFEVVVLCGISTPFGMLSPARGQITHVLLTRAPLYRGRSPFSCDLHVLGAPLTFVLSQDQTLQLDPSADTFGAKPPVPPYSFTMISLTAGRGGARMERFAGGASPAKLFRGYEAQFSRTEGLSFRPERGVEPSPRPQDCQTKITAFRANSKTRLSA